MSAQAKPTQAMPTQVMPTQVNLSSMSQGNIPAQVNISQGDKPIQANLTKRVNFLETPQESKPVQTSNSSKVSQEGKPVQTKPTYRDIEAAIIAIVKEFSTRSQRMVSLCYVTSKG